MNYLQRAIVTRGHTRMLQMNRPIPGSKNSHFQNEAQCKTFFLNGLYLHENKKIILYQWLCAQPGFKLETWVEIFYSPEMLVACCFLTVMQLQFSKPQETCTSTNQTSQIFGEEHARSNFVLFSNRSGRISKDDLKNVLRRLSISMDTVTFENLTKM